MQEAQLRFLFLCFFSGISHGLTRNTRRGFFFCAKVQRCGEKDAPPATPRDGASSGSRGGEREERRRNEDRNIGTQEFPGLDCMKEG